MTQTIALNGSGPEINPLYIKLRRHFASPDNRTIGEVKIMQAISDGYQPYTTPVRRTSGHSVSEHHVTRANSLPTVGGVSRVKRTSTLSGGAIAGIVMASVAVAGTGGFATWWFAVKKNSFDELMGIVKGAFNKPTPDATSNIDVENTDTDLRDTESE